MWPEFKGRDGCRTPMAWEKASLNGGFSSGKPWLPVAAQHLPAAVDAQAGDETSLLEHYRRFLTFRRAHPALAKGDIDFLAADGDAVVFTRDLGNERIACAFNFGSGTADLDLGAEAASIEGHGFDGAASGGKLRLGPYQAWFGRLG